MNVLFSKFVRDVINFVNSFLNSGSEFSLKLSGESLNLFGLDVNHLPVDNNLVRRKTPAVTKQPGNEWEGNIDDVWAIKKFWTKMKK